MTTHHVPHQGSAATDTAPPEAQRPDPAAAPLAATLFLGLIEWDSGEDPTIFLGATRHDVERLATQCLDAMEPGDIDDAPTFHADHPTPDFDDPIAVRAWLDALKDATCIPGSASTRPSPATPKPAPPGSRHRASRPTRQIPNPRDVTPIRTFSEGHSW